MNQSSLITLMPLVLLIVIMYFLLIRPQKKREKAVTAMRNAVKVGDEIITIGGICGKVVKTKDETLTIQVGADKTKFEIMRWAVSKVENEPATASSRKTKKEEPEETEETTKKSLPKRMKKAELDIEPEKKEAEVEAPQEAEVTEETKPTEEN